jgi:hypothetical protein
VSCHTSHHPQCLYHEALDHGIQIEVVGADLSLTGPSHSQHLLATCYLHRAQLAAIMQSGRCPCTTDVEPFVFGQSLSLFKSGPFEKDQYLALCELKRQRTSSHPS